MISLIGPPSPLVSFSPQVSEISSINTRMSGEKTTGTKSGMRKKTGIAKFTLEVVQSSENSGRVLNIPRSWNTLRHTYATLCVKKHIDSKVVCENTGDSFEVIIEVYSNPSLETMKADAEVVMPVGINSLDLAPGPQLDFKANVEKLWSERR